MASKHEEFWQHSSFAFVGHTAKKGFPKLSFGALKRQGKKVFAVDPSVDQIEGEKTYADLRSLPEKVEAVVLEVPKEETLPLMKEAAEAGVKDVWIHMNRDTPEALEFARQQGINVLTGTCAVMYADQSLSYHALHRWVNKLLGKY
jgi:predicted CoA-binding protein